MGLGAALWQELLSGSPDNIEIARTIVRLLLAIVLGGILGFQRAHVGKAAGMRTHMLVTLGAAVVVLTPQLIGMSSADLSRIIQGTLTGIGFIGGGVILKMSDEHQIVGITTAATIWLTATIGIAVGTGRWAWPSRAPFWPTSSSRSSVGWNVRLSPIANDSMECGDLSPLCILP